MTATWRRTVHLIFAVEPTSGKLDLKVRSETESSLTPFDDKDVGSIIASHSG